MPIYDYRCGAGHRFDKLVRLSDPPVTECPVNGCDAPVTKLVAPTNFALKGDGWAKDNYGLKGAPAK